MDDGKNETKKRAVRYRLLGTRTEIKKMGDGWLLLNGMGSCWVSDTPSIDPARLFGFWPPGGVFRASDMGP